MLVLALIVLVAVLLCRRMAETFSLMEFRRKLMGQKDRGEGFAEGVTDAFKYLGDALRLR